MSVRNWPSLAAKTAVAASLLAAAAACSSSGSSSPPAAAGATSAAPLSTAALVSGSKQEKGLLIYSNALLVADAGGHQGVPGEVPVDPRHRHR